MNNLKEREKKMKTMKKALAILLTVAMVLALGVTVFAEDTTPTSTENKGTITISNPEKDVEYTAYKIFEAVPFEGSNDEIKPTASTQGSAVYYATAAQKTYWGNNGSKLFVFTQEGDKYNVSLQENVGAKEIAEFFNNNEKDEQLLDNVTSAGTVKAEEGKPVTWTVDYGYYFISSNSGSVVSIDTTNKDVVIEDKNNYSEPFDPGQGDNPDGQLKNVYKVNGTVAYKTEGETQSVVPVSVKIDDTVTYRISTSTSNYVTKVKEGKDVSEKVTYVSVNDALETGLTLDDKSFVVTVKQPGVEGVTPVAADKYEVASKEVTGKKVFTVKLQWVDGNGDAIYKDGSVLNIEYNATVNDTIQMVGEDGKASENADNTANVTIDSEEDNSWKPEDPTDPIPDPDPVDPTDPDALEGKDVAVKESSVSVYIYALALLKVDGADETKTLKDAHFEISKGKDSAPLTFTKKNDGFYYYDKNGKADLVTPENGIIVVKGVDAGTFTLKETKAPTGYNVMTSTVDFESIVAGTTTTKKTVSTTTYYKESADGTFKKDGDKFVELTEEEKTSYDGTKYAVTDTKAEGTEEVTSESNEIFGENAVTMKVLNNTGAELPSTGGMGTTIFYMVGAILVLGAGILLVTRKRMAVR